MQNNEGFSQISDNPSPVQLFFRNKWVRLFLIADVILLLILVCVFIWQATKVSTISFNITPLDATITVNGDNRYQNGQYSITPGTYQIAIAHDGLETKNLTVDVSPEHVASITAFLSDANHNFDFYQLRNNYTSYLKLAEIASSNNNLTTDHDTSAENFIQEFQDNYHIFTTQLPIEYQESEGYGSNLQILKNITIKANYNCEKTLCVQALVAGTDSKDFVNQLLQEKGFNTEDFEIEYKFY